ncbi:MerR family transcriptional regulator [Paeniglutamicibacter cryotolerans]|uniref:DNA-binding transcriptional MerR regulator n=1 Tax=Paeniglutamicibacter cryotolerans TaxID=670079 RepID=A0A839QQM7_9MICC|nr:DNA-binding transcriptional MerR regulator [Paeniglutamicibacter cryotolerans]
MTSTAHTRRLTALGAEPVRLAALNIGEVLSELNGDFPQITASKIRFLEEKGLITPQRTSAGYRKYLPGDVGRLRFILGLQRDQYLPLKVIKDHLDAVDRGEAPEQLPGGVALAPRGVTDAMAQKIAGHSRPLTRAELQGSTGASAELIADLLSFGMIAEENDRFGEHAQRITEASAKLAAHGIEPRHLRAFRAAADRELGLVERAVAPLSARRDVASRARAADTAREITDACMALHGALVNGAIAKLDH